VGNFIQLPIGKRNATVFSYRKNFRESERLEITKVNKDNSLFKDRLDEVTTFFKINRFSLLMHYLRNGTPNTNYYRQRLEAHFDKEGTDATKLKNTYESLAFMYANRALLRSHGYGLGLNILSIAENHLALKPSELCVLDYGCGVADPSLFLSMHGATVTLVDLEGTRFEFAKRRFEDRDLKYEPLGATQTEAPVKIDKMFNVIIMAEFLEHVRNPRLFLEYALSHLETGAVFYDSLGATHNHGVGGQHLIEAKEQMEKTDYKDFFLKHFEPLNAHFKCDGYEHFYIKK